MRVRVRVRVVGGHACIRSSSTRQPLRSASLGTMCASPLMKDSSPSFLVMILPKMSLWSGSMMLTTCCAYDLEPIVYTCTCARVRVRVEVRLRVRVRVKVRARARRRSRAS